MKRTPAIALAIVSTTALCVVLFQQPASQRVFAAAQAPTQSQPIPVQNGQPQQSQPSKPNGPVVVLNGKPYTPAEMLQIQLSGLQDQIKDLQAQLKTDETTIHTLQSSLQTLQTQFNNHSHKVTTFVQGHFCMGLNQYIVTEAGTGKQVRVGLETVQDCGNPKWNGSTPSGWESLNVSTPVQGAQTPQ
jgi:hypothetical protein